MITENCSKNGAFSLDSELLGKEITFHVIFPGNYKNSAEKFPVVYLLHGLFGHSDNWLNYTRIAEYAKNKSLILVCAEGGDSWYSDNSQIKTHFYESYILDELIPAVEEKFKVNSHKNKRAIVGLSMGGYGAFKFAFRRPELFCLAASMSGAFHAAEIVAGDDWTQLHNSVASVFGNDRWRRDKNDLFQIVENFPVEKIRELPYFYLDCGAEDDFLPVNLRLSNSFQKRGIAHEFKILSGGHNWNYWDLRLKEILIKAEVRTK